MLKSEEKYREPNRRMSECQAKLVWYWLSEEEETERSEVTDRPVSTSFSLAEKVKDNDE
jgi:hypothetical protein